MLGKTMVRNIVYKWCLKLEKKATNNKNNAFGELLTILFEAFICWSDDLLIANFHANGLDLTLPCQIAVGLTSIFGQISPPISLYHFPLLQEFDLKKASSPFNVLDKFLKPTPALSFPLTVRHGKIAFEHVTRPLKKSDRKQRGKINAFCS